MDAPTPTAFPLDPDNVRVPEGFPAPSPDEGEVVLLLADEEPRRAGWASVAAVELSRTWARAGLRVFLADGDLTNASLHSLVGEENGEGLADAIIYGASPGRVSRRVEGSFLFAPAGTVVPDPMRAYSDPRWSTLMAGFRDSGSVLILYLPAEAEGMDELLAEGDRIIRVCDALPEDEGEPGVFVLHRTPVVPGAGAARRKGEEAPDRKRDAGKLARRRVLPWIAAVVVVLVVAGVLAAAWLGYFAAPGFDPSFGAAEPASPDPTRAGSTRSG